MRESDRHEARAHADGERHDTCDGGFHTPRYLIELIQAVRCRAASAFALAAPSFLYGTGAAATCMATTLILPMAAVPSMLPHTRSTPVMSSSVSARPVRTIATGPVSVRTSMSSISALGGIAIVSE